MIANKMPKVAVIALSIASLCLASNTAEAKSKEKSNKADKAVSVKQSKSDKSIPSNDAALRNQVSQITKALSDGNAKTMAALWTTDGTYIDEDGAIYKGRAAIEERFADVFKQAGRPSLELVSETQNFITDNIALSEGIVRIKSGLAVGNAETRFSIVFVKQDGGWLIKSATETPLAATAIVNPLEELSWIIGEWAAERNGGSVRMKAEWAANKNFITCYYETKKSQDAKPTLSKQVIGWDPRNDQPISWHFDSTGGFGLGHWVKSGKRWEIEASGVERDGSSSLATNIMTPSDKDSFVWQSLNRSVDGVSFTDTAPLKIQRTAK